MSRLRSFLSVLVMASAVVLIPHTVVAQTDVTGKWLFSVTTGAGTGTPTVTLKQLGDSLTGHYSSQRLGEADLTGTAKGGKISFAINVEAQGTRLLVTYSGSVQADGTLKGEVDLGGQASGTFTAKRQ